MNLAWGATWLTSAVVFGSILVMLLLATRVADRWSLPPRLSLILLALTLVVSYVSPVHALLARGWPVKLALSVLVIGSPIFFASTLFAARFKARTRTDVALGWNLLGAVLGGLLEFGSMIVGIRALCLVALALYLGSALVAGARREAAAI
jgi:hypothetical protein